LASGSQPAVASSDDIDLPGSTGDAFSIRCWGTRGSIPSPGPSTAGFGGNTPCLEVTAGGRTVIFDAGTGIRLLGEKLQEREGSVRATIFLTHFHWDHIQGFPFFGPLYDPGADLEIFGPEQGDLDIRTLFAGQMGPIYFPIPFEAVGARVDFRPMNEEEWAEDGVGVRSLRVRHPSFTVGYRLDAPGGTFCYVPDNELGGGEYPLTAGWKERFLAFLEGADVLFHDAMLTEEEYPSRTGWGHSTFGQAVDLAGEAGVDRLYFFHHAPERSDVELDEIVERFREDVDRRGLDLEVGAAFEGEDIRIEGG